MKHDHPWAAYNNSDAVSGDMMKWVPQLPSISAANGLYFLILPYWELMLFFLGCGAVGFLLERRKITRHVVGVDTDPVS